MKKIIVCDISNIACFNKRNGKPKIGYIDILFNSIPKDYKIIGIADNSLYHQIDDQKRYKTEYLISKLIFEAPAGVAADIFILKCATEHQCLIISNDLFREYSLISKNWLKNHRIGFMIIDHNLFFTQNLEEDFKFKENAQFELDFQLQFDNLITGKV